MGWNPVRFNEKLFKDLLASREIENIFENSDFIYMLNQGPADTVRFWAKAVGEFPPTNFRYATHSGPGEGLLFFGNVIIPFWWTTSQRTHSCTACLPQDRMKWRGPKREAKIKTEFGGENNGIRQGISKEAQQYPDAGA